MEVEELAEDMYELIKQGYSQLDISLMLTKQFVRGDILYCLLTYDWC